MVNILNTIKSVLTRKVTLPSPVAKFVRAVNHPIRTAENVAKKTLNFVANPTAPQNRNFATGFRVASTPVIATASFARGLQSVGRASVNAVKSSYARMYAPTSIKTLGKAIGATAVAGAGFGLVKYGVSGNPRDLLAGPQAFATLLGFRVAPIPAVFGGIQGGIERVGDVATNVLHPTQTIPQFELPDLSNVFPQVSIPSYTPGDFSFVAPASSTNVTIGGGGDNGLQNILFAVLASGGFGYLFGRRKRRKKYKARRRRK